MKRILFIFLIAFIFIGCASMPSASNGDVWEVTVDDITGNEKIQHKDLKPGIIYNVEDNISGMREHINAVINDNLFCIYTIFQYQNWLFQDELVILDENQNRLTLKSDKNNRDVYSGYVVETVFFFPTEAEIEQLHSILQSEKVSVCFIGSKGRLEKKALKPKVQNALLQTVEKYLEN